MLTSLDVNLRINDVNLRIKVYLVDLVLHLFVLLDKEL